MNENYDYHYEIVIDTDGWKNQIDPELTGQALHVAIDHLLWDAIEKETSNSDFQDALIQQAEMFSDEELLDGRTLAITTSHAEWLQQ